jgi:predicted transcriptional regulator
MLAAWQADRHAAHSALPRHDTYPTGRADHRDFTEAFAAILKGYEITAPQLAAKAGVPQAFVEALRQGEPEPDLHALRRVGEALDLDAPHFVGVAVQAALRHRA